MLRCACAPPRCRATLLSTALHCRPGPPKLLPRLLALDSPALEAAAATGSGGVQAAAWVDERRLLVLSGIASSSSGLLVELEIDEAAGTATEVAAVDRHVPPVLCAASRPAGGVLLQLRSGALLLYSAGGGMEALPASAGFSQPCPQMAATPGEAAGGDGGAAGGPAAIGLSAGGQLYWGARQLAAGVTSFAVRGRERAGGNAVVVAACPASEPDRSAALPCIPHAASYLTACLPVMAAATPPSVPPCSCGTAAPAAPTCSTPPASTRCTRCRWRAWPAAAAWCRRSRRSSRRSRPRPCIRTSRQLCWRRCGRRRAARRAQM